MIRKLTKYFITGLLVYSFIGTIVGGLPFLLYKNFEYLASSTGAEAFFNSLIIIVTLVVMLLIIMCIGFVVTKLREINDDE